VDLSIQTTQIFGALGEVIGSTSEEETVTVLMSRFFASDPNTAREVVKELGNNAPGWVIFLAEGNHSEQTSPMEPPQ